MTAGHRLRDAADEPVVPMMPEFTVQISKCQIH
jgi:hypothetical protein